MTRFADIYFYQIWFSRVLRMLPLPWSYNIAFIFQSFSGLTNYDIWSLKTNKNKILRLEIVSSMPSTLKCNKISPNTIYNNLTHSVPPHYPMANPIKQIHNKKNICKIQTHCSLPGFRRGLVWYIFDENYYLHLSVWIIYMVARSDIVTVSTTIVFNSS